MRCDFRASPLARPLASPCFGHEPKAKVATKTMYMYGGCSHGNGLGHQPSHVDFIG